MYCYPHERGMMILDPGMAILDRMPRPSRRSRPLPAFVSQQVVAADRYFLDLRPAADRPLAVVCGGMERVRADYVVARDDFPYCCVEFVAAGRGTVSLRGREFPLGPGSVFAYGSGVPHVIRSDRRRRLRKYYVDFVGREASARLRGARLAPGGHLTVGRPREIEEVFDLLQQCGRTQSRHSQLLCTQLLGVLLTKIAERALPPESGDAQAFATYERFREFLAADRQRLTSVDQASREFGISSAYACRLFRRFDAVSPYQYLLRQRMNLAADLITHDRLLVKHVAAHLGFADQYQFSRAFKRVSGIAPGRLLGR
jgi:AraC-like DNA-binding protein